MGAGHALWARKPDNLALLKKTVTKKNNCSTTVESK